ncbi:MAG: hypothetical protein P8K77_09860 [Polaribacter sp.]|nr:hypothetical protein [Polaribacter sp.]
MMKKIKTVYKLIIVLIIFSACTDDLRDLSFLENIDPPSNVSAAYQITQDNTGLVTIIPSADGATFFDISFGDGTADSEKLKSGENVQNIYSEGTYQVKIIAYNINGDSTEKTQQLIVSFKGPENLVVLIENDNAVSKKVTVTANADFATMFDFYTGETGNTTPVSGNIGATVSYTYQNAGTYSIKVVAKGAAIATSEYTVDFEVTEILQPIVAAPKPPTREAIDVVSIYSDEYTDISVSEWNPGWGQSTVLTTVAIAGNNTLRYADLNYTGIVTDYGNPTDISTMEYVHFDYWTPDATAVSFKLVNTSSSGASKESEVAVSSIGVGSWKSVEIKLSEYTTDLTGITQMLFSSSNAIVFIDNLYFYKSPSATSSVAPIDFETPFSLSSFDGGEISLVDNPDTNGNSSAMVAKMVKGAGQTWAGSKITVPQPFSFSGGTNVKVKVWSPRVGLNLLLKFEDATPWPNTTASAEITSTTTVANGWEELTFDFSGISTTVDFTNLVLIMDNGTNGDGSSDYTIYVDDISSTPFLDFEPLQTLSSFDGGEISIVANPDTNGNSSAMVAKMVKGAGQTWAGSKITVPQPFSFSGGTNVKVKVWSPRAGLNLLLKFEDATPWPNTAASAEITSTTTVANGWEELTFDFSGISTTVNFTNLVLIMDNGTNGDGSSNYTIYVDDITQF